MWQTASERMSEAGAGDQEETIVEYVVRERLTKDQLVELLVSLGGQKQGSRDELGERLLAIRGLKPRDVLTKLATDDLKVVIRRFGVPEPSKSGGLMGFANAVLSDDRSSMVKRIDEVAIKQRTPIPRGHPQPPRSDSQPASMTGEAPAAREPAPVRAPAPASVPTNPPERTSEAVSRTPPIPSVGGTPAGLPVFQETRDFVGATSSPTSGTPRTSTRQSCLARCAVGSVQTMRSASKAILAGFTILWSGTLLGLRSSYRSKRLNSIG